MQCSECGNASQVIKTMYQLDFAATMLLITGYDPKRRAMVIDRWLKLETGVAVPAMANNSAIDAMVGQVLAMVVPVVVKQAVAAVMAEVQPLVQTMQKQLNTIQINFSHVGTVWSFHYHCCQEGGYNTFVPKDELYAAYVAYCDTFPYCRAEGKTGFLSKLYKAFTNSSAAVITVDGRRVAAVRGISLLPGYEQIIEDKRRQRKQEAAKELASRRKLLFGIEEEQQEDCEVQ